MSIKDKKIPKLIRPKDESEYDVCVWINRRKIVFPAIALTDQRKVLIEKYLKSGGVIERLPPDERIFNQTRRGIKGKWKDVTQ